MVTQSEVEWVDIKTTIPSYPLPAADARPIVKTQRLILRPCSAADAQGLHALRLQEEVMVWTAQGRPDRDLEETQQWLKRFLPPDDTYSLNYTICLIETGEIIGIGGSHRKMGELGWPELGYMIRKETWGKGYATEFLRGFLEAWWALPRAEVNLRVDKHTVTDPGEVKEECLVAITVDYNKPSQGVLRKAGLELSKVWISDDEHKIGSQITLFAYLAKKPAGQSIQMIELAEAG